MKTLVTYSSLTGNTKKIAEAIFPIIKGEKEIMPIADVTNLDNYTQVIVGYWVDKGDVNEDAQQFMAKVMNKPVGIFGTLGADPDSEHAKDCTASAVKRMMAGGNTVQATFLCQGAIDPQWIAQMRKSAVTPEQEKRWIEAAKHPNADDCAAAQKAFAAFAPTAK